MLVVVVFVVVTSPLPLPPLLMLTCGWLRVARVKRGQSDPSDARPRPTTDRDRPLVVTRRGVGRDGEPDEDRPRAARPQLEAGRVARALRQRLQQVRVPTVERVSRIKKWSDRVALGTTHNGTESVRVLRAKRGPEWRAPHAPRRTSRPRRAAPRCRPGLARGGGVIKCAPPSACAQPQL